MVVAIDHAAYMGEGPPLDIVSKVAAGSPDGILATWEIARTCGAALARSGLVLRVDGGISELGGMPADDTSGILYRADQAVTLGADAVVVMVFPGAPDEELSLQRLANLCGECELIGLPVIAETIPGGWAKAVPWDTKNVLRAARIAVELGADVVKTVCPGPVDEFAAVTAGVPAPVVALGGPKSESEDEVVALAAGVVAAGAAGIAFGRNVWGSADPAALIGRLNDAVHGT